MSRHHHVDPELHEAKHSDIVSSIRVERKGVLAYLRVWNRGNHSGTLIVEAADADEFVRRLFRKPH